MAPEQVINRGTRELSWRSPWGNTPSDAGSVSGDLMFRALTLLLALSTYHKAATSSLMTDRPALRRRG